MANAPTRKTSEAELNQFNIWMRSQPWYQDFYKQRGLDPSGYGNRKLSRKEQSQLEDLMQANGVPLDGGMHIDSGGSANQKNRLVRNAAITAAATAAALGTAGIGPLGFLGGAGSAGAGGGAAGTAGSTAALPTLASTPIGSAAVAAPTLTGASTIGGVVGGAGTAASALPTLASRSITSGASQGPMADAGRSTLDRVSDAATNGRSGMDRVGDLLREGGNVLGANAATAAHNRGQALDARLAAEKLNREGEASYQDQLLARAKDEAAQRDEARKNLYRANVMKNPMMSPENRGPAPTFSPEMMEGLTNLEKQALARTADEPQYTSAKMRAPRDFAPLDPEKYTKPGTMETVSNWLAPGLSMADRIFDFF